MSIQPTKGTGLTLLELKLRAAAKENDDKQRQQRRRNLLVLIQDYLLKCGYVDSLNQLEKECGINLKRWRTADNMDLWTILSEFEEFFQLKYGKAAKVVRSTGGNEDGDESNSTAAGGNNSGKTSNTNGGSNHTGTVSSSSSSSSGVSSANSKRNSNLPPLPPGVGNQPLALPAAYRDRIGYSHVDDSSSAGSSAPQSKSQSQSKASPSSASAGPSSQKGSRVGSGKGGARSSTTSKSNQSSPPPESQSLDFAVSGSGSPFTNSSSSSSSSSNPKSTNIKSAEQQLNRKLAVTGASQDSEDDDNLRNHSHSTTQSALSALEHDGIKDDPQDYFDSLVTKPLPSHYSGQYRELAETIQREIYSANPNIRWSDIAELEAAKQLLKEAVVMPMKFPQFFTGLLSPWKGILLYGPPGTGKTLLARAVATECRTTFFNISASSIVSKYRGDSEKLVRVLFELARYYSPSTIFIDEIDALMGTRDGNNGNGDGDASRRMKTELLIQMDGLNKSADLVFVLAASNLPWDLDMALLRRLEKRILVPLPTEKGRYTIAAQHLRDRLAPGLGEKELWELARLTERYSGADLVLLCKEAAMRPVRRLMKRLMAAPSEEDMRRAERLENSDGDSEADGEDKRFAQVQLDPVQWKDVKMALKVTRSSAAVKQLEKYQDWHKEFGATIEVDEDEDGDDDDNGDQQD